MPRSEALERAAVLADACSGVLAPDASFLPAGLDGDRVRAVAPGIDPLDPRNLELEPRLPGRVVRSLGVDLDRPFVLQVLELDRWDDPHTTIECFRLAREEAPGLQLVLAAQFDAAAAEAWRAAKEVSDYSAGMEDLLLLTSYEPLGSLELGALQHLARVVLEISTGEGLHLGPCEALWKRTPVVGGSDGGLHITVRDGVDGFLTERRGGHRAQGRGAGPRPGPGRGDGSRGPRTGARALPRHGGRRTGAASAGGAGLTPVSPATVVAP